MVVLGYHYWDLAPSANKKYGAYRRGVRWADSLHVYSKMKERRDAIVSLGIV